MTSSNRAKAPTDPPTRTRTEAMIHLLGDEDPKIRSSVWSQLEQLLDDQMVGGEPILDELSEAERSSPDPRVGKQAGCFRSG